MLDGPIRATGRRRSSGASPGRTAASGWLQGNLLPTRAGTASSTACHQLASEGAPPGADVRRCRRRLSPDAAAQLQAERVGNDLALVLGLFRARFTGSLGEAVAIPQIMVVLPGYLPLPMAAPQIHRSGFAAGLRGRMNDGSGGGLRACRRPCRVSPPHARRAEPCPRKIRRGGGRTRHCPTSTPLAGVAGKMYHSWAELLGQDFTKNATEGMATPRAPAGLDRVLGGGHVAALAASSAIAVGPVQTSRPSFPPGDFIVRSGGADSSGAAAWPTALSVLLAPVGVASRLAINGTALIGARRGRQGRSGAGGELRFSVSDTPEIALPRLRAAFSLAGTSLTRRPRSPACAPLFPGRSGRPLIAAAISRFGHRGRGRDCHRRHRLHPRRHSQTLGSVMCRHGRTHAAAGVLRPLPGRTRRSWREGEGRGRHPVARGTYPVQLALVPLRRPSPPANRRLC